MVEEEKIDNRLHQNLNNNDNNGDLNEINKQLKNSNNDLINGGGVFQNQNDKLKSLLKIIFCPCYCLFYKSFEWIWDGRCSETSFYKDIIFLQNIAYCILSIIDLVFLIINKDKTVSSFFIVRIISDCIGIFSFWLCIVLWDKDANDEDNFELAIFFLTFLFSILMDCLDLSSFIIFVNRSLQLNIIMMISFIVHLVIILGFIIFYIITLFSNCL